ncbi:MAG: GNAT family N-acetyltransferase [Deltaproteobacteria bacterium]|nr:GNAT family N-acetyltransferase [Deltaproteobacteria bacterium]
MAVIIETLSTPRLRILRLDESHADAVAAFQRRNREHLASTSPVRASTFFEAEHWRRLARARTAPMDELGAVLWLLQPVADQESGPIIGTVQLSNIVRGSFWACHLGYALDHAHVGRGLMTEGLRAVLDHAFEIIGLHRVMANYIPNNERSGAVLERLGFVREGLARDYLFIDGRWQDHVLTALVNPRPRDPPARPPPRG